MIPDLVRQESKISDRIMAAGNRQDDKSDFNLKSRNPLILLKGFEVGSALVGSYTGVIGKSKKGGPYHDEYLCRHKRICT